MSDPVLRMRGVRKAFNGVEVLKGVDLDLERGEVHALLGGNGAGKSTLMKILEGVYTLDEGTIEVDGKPVALSTPGDARRHGIAMIFQEFSLIPTLTVAQNIFLTRERRRALLLDDAADVVRARRLLDDIGVDIDPRWPVRRLPTAGWQLVEIAKAISQEARILIMDEPTASLAHSEVEALFRIIGHLKEQGITIVYITHRLEEVMAVADRVTVLRDGERVTTQPTADLDMDQLIELIVGRAVHRDAADTGARRPVARDGTPLLRVRGLSTGDHVRGIDLDLYPGEVVGLAGLMGSGRSELARALFGIDPTSGGTTEVRGAPVRIRRPADAIRQGIVLVPEDRRTQGLVLAHSVRDNLTLTMLRQLTRNGLLDERAATRVTDQEIERLDIKVRSVRAPVRRLSGGNQQKVVLSKWLATDPDILILDEPTVGVDISTKTEIADLVRSLAAQGKGVIVISSELGELLALADRILVMRDGALERTLERGEVDGEPHLHRLVQEQPA